MINIAVNANNGVTNWVAGENFQTNAYGTDFASPAERERAMAWLRRYMADGFHIENIGILDTERRQATDFTDRLMRELSGEFNLQNQAVTTRTPGPNLRRG